MNIFKKSFNSVAIACLIAALLVVWGGCSREKHREKLVFDLDDGGWLYRPATNPDSLDLERPPHIDESLVARIYYSGSSFPFNSGYALEIERTATGAVAICRLNLTEESSVYARHSGKTLEIEMSREEWLDIINSLNQNHVNQWLKAYTAPLLDGSGWRFGMFSENGDTLMCLNAYPSVWDEFIKIINVVIEKIFKAADDVN